MRVGGLLGSGGSLLLLLLLRGGHLELPLSLPRPSVGSRPTSTAAAVVASSPLRAALGGSGFFIVVVLLHAGSAGVVAAGPAGSALVRIFFFHLGRGGAGDGRGGGARGPAVDSFLLVIAAVRGSHLVEPFRVGLLVTFFFLFVLFG